MCMDIRKSCECGKERVQFHMRDNVLLPEVLVRLYCPECHGPDSFDADLMINDNGWIIEYDMLLAQMTIVQKLMMDVASVTPAFIFDEGYACWQEMYPGEQQEIQLEKKKIIELMKTDQKKYLATIQQWNINRIEELKAQGWRKVQRA